MPSITEAERLHELFQGRPDAVYNDGVGCWKGDVDWLEGWALHLSGHVNFGIYPLRPFENPARNGPDVSWLVRWGCSDFDLGYAESWPHAVNLHNTFKVLGLHPFIERSKSKGFHVWLFADGWVPADVMRRAFLYAHQVCGAPPREVNPKGTESDDPTFVGNCVRMPWFNYGDRHAPRPKGQRMLHAWHPEAQHHDAGPLLTDWLNVAEGSRASVDQLSLLADRYVPPVEWRQQTVLVNISGLPEVNDAEAERIIRKGNSALLYVKWRDGPDGRRDRSSELAAAAYLCEEAGLSADDALTVVAAYDEKWLHKYSERRDAERRYVELIERAYG